MTKTLAIAFSLMLTTATAFAAAPVAPTVTAPTVTSPTAPTVAAPAAAAPTAATPMTTRQPLTAAQQAKVAERVAIIKKQLTDLTPAEQAAALHDAKPDRAPLSADQKDAMRHKHFAMAEQKWNGKSAADKAELREHAADRWNELTAQEKAYKRDRIAEQLKAIPAADRQQIIEAANK